MKFLLPLLLSTCVAAPATAQEMQCASRLAVVAQLAEGYGESLKTVSTLNDGRLLETYANEGTGSWTITIQKAGEPEVCLLLAGNNFVMMNRALPPNL